MQPVRDLELNISNFPIKLQTVAEPDVLLDELVGRTELEEEALEDDIPYWAELWSSAVAMARFLADSELVKPGMMVHELGCGLGLPGLVAGLLGAELIFSDHLPAAVDFAKRNWALNMDRAARFERMDWRRPLSDLSADLVLASDVAYEERFFTPLCEAFHLLCRPGGSILLSEPSRAMAAEFTGSLQERGFRVQRFPQFGTWQSLPYEVGIYRLWPKGK